MKPEFLMCAPDFFGVRYAINPWMDGQIGQVDSALALRQWSGFYEALKQTAQVHLIDPHPHVPDLVFTANAGLVSGDRFIASRFRHEERRREEPLFLEWFEENSDTRHLLLPKHLAFEGAGDALVQPGTSLLWMGYGFRTDLEAHHFLRGHYQGKVISLKLVHPSFYHLDTCFCPLPEGRALYYPAAFPPESLQLIEKHIPPENRIVVPEADARYFACNAVLSGRTLFMNHASPALQQAIENKGLVVSIQPVTEFLKAGGANKCLTLALSG